MCGIAGVVDRSIDDLGSVVTDMRDALRHRGPDGAGLRIWRDHGVGLGHRRLAIIDTSEAGVNPIANEDGTVWVVLNGEITNFRALRSELERAGHAFQSQSDTEVIVHAYEEWGDQHVARLRGFFAYALYDRRPSGRTLEGRNAAFRLLLVRDRLGVKPLYYAADGGRMVFGSEIKAVIRHPAVSRAIDRSALFDFLTYSCVPAPKTAFRAVRSLLPGHLMTVDATGHSIAQYWDVPVGDEEAQSAEAAAQQTRAAIDDVVASYLESDVPIGSFMSGGIDSGLVTAMASARIQNLATFSMGFDVAGKSETHYSTMLAAALGTDHHVTIADGTALPELPERILDMFDDPFADGSALPTAQLSRFAARHRKVVLSGDGGDEVFAGYNRYSSWLAQIRRPPWHRPRAWLRSRLGPSPHWDHGSFAPYVRRLELFSPEEKRRWLAPEWVNEFRHYDDYWRYREHWRPDLDPVTRVQYVDLKTYLPDDILTKIDRASMAASLEVRPPLLDHVLIERTLRLPAAIRMPHGRGKALLKGAAAGILPAAIIARPKQGFSAPLTSWVTAAGAWVDRAWRESATGFLHSSGPEPSIPRYGEKMWAAVLADRWLRRHG